MVTQFYDQMLAPAGIGITQFSMLTVIGAHEELTIKAAAVIFGLDRTTLSRNLRPLERQGWIEIQHGADRRSRLLTLTDKGRDVADRALPLWQEAQKRMLSLLGDEDWAAMKPGLDRTNAALSFTLNEMF